MGIQWTSTQPACCFASHRALRCGAGRGMWVWSTSSLLTKPANQDVLVTTVKAAGVTGGTDSRGSWQSPCWAGGLPNIGTWIELPAPPTGNLLSAARRFVFLSVPAHNLHHQPGRHLRLPGQAHGCVQHSSCSFLISPLAVHAAYSLAQSNQQALPG